MRAIGLGRTHNFVSPESSHERSFRMSSAGHSKRHGGEMESFDRLASIIWLSSFCRDSRFSTWSQREGADGSTSRTAARRGHRTNRYASDATARRLQAYGPWEGTGHGDGSNVCVEHETSGNDAQMAPIHKYLIPRLTQAHPGAFAVGSTRAIFADHQKGCRNKGGCDECKNQLARPAVSSHKLQL
jgi:hypothetical protein